MSTSRTFPDPAHPDIPTSRTSRHLAIRLLVGVLTCAALVWLYASAATEHGRQINTSKARGDQSGYLWDAQNVYANWHGRQPPSLIGERNRMPLYAGYLALFYDPSMTDPEFFEVGKVANIYPSLVLLVVLGFVLWWHLPPWSPST